MGRRLLWSLMVGLTLVLAGCITDQTPKQSVVELAPGATQLFTAVSDDRTAELVWYLDNRRVAYDRTRYTFTAEQLSNGEAVTHTLIVREEGSSNQWYYRLIGLPEGYVSSVAWTIRVVPPAGPQTCYLDEDGDGYGAADKMMETDDPPANCLDNADDCNDDDAAVNPGAAETCNGIDDNCNGDIDDGISPEGTSCGVGACAGNTGTSSCVDGAMVDTCDPFAGATVEVCDGVDNDCNGQIDDGIVCACTLGQTRTVQCGVGACTSTGIETCINGEWSGSTCVAGTATQEICNGIDDDCDGQVDDGIAAVATTCGVGACAGNVGTESCVDGVLVNTCDPTGGATAEICDGLDNDCDGAPDDGISCACANGDTRTVQCGLGACASTGTETCVNGEWSGSTCIAGDANPETCNGIDDDCDGQIDNGIVSTVTTCGIGACASTGTLACVGGEMIDSCEAGPSGTEICNGIDDDCDGQIDNGIASTPTTCGIGACVGNTGVSGCVDGVMVDSCDPTAGATAEICDGLDNDCNGNTDDGISCACTNGETRNVQCGVGACAATGIETCINGEWADSTCVAGTATAEVCDGIDNDCDGSVDNGIETQMTTCGIGACAGTGTLSCVAGEMLDSCQTGEPVAEICNGVDDDCDGSIDEDVQITFYRDADGDNYGDAALTLQACSAPSGYVENSTDCDDALAAVHPGATEVCNERDDDCDSQIDEGVKLTFYHDADGDGYGNAADTTEACTAPANYVTDTSDCDDSLASVHPGAAESCNEMDDNCNGSIDEGVQTTYYRDADGDGYGNAAVTTLACATPPGYVSDTSDCDDSLASVNPGAAESCNEMDDNCNGSIDEGVQLTFYRDSDGDTYGNAAETTLACTMPSGYVADASDCDDGLAEVHPGAEEVCNGMDDDCDAAIDEGVQLTFYRDADGDQYGNANETTLACSVPDGYVADFTDCDDTLAGVHPNAAETCNEIDDNCNSQVDEGVQITFYLDGDGDGYGTTATTLACSVPAGYAEVGGDCDDGSATVHPGATETCNGIDDNCGGMADEPYLTFYTDADGDGYGDGEVQACAIEAGLSENPGDCDDTSAAVHPGAVEICNDIDDNCNGLVDGDEVACSVIPPTPLDVAASDIDSGLTDVVVTWSASSGATYYNVYRAAWDDENSNYVLVGDHITDTSYAFVQDWKVDVLDPTGTFPETPEGDIDALLAALDEYHDNMVPHVLNFKCPAFFRVEACSDAGCSAPSASDAGQAEFIHTADYSELSQMAAPMWMYPVLKTVASVSGLDWCGADVCGSGGGMTMGRLTGMQVDMYFENYTEGWASHDNAALWFNGYLGGAQTYMGILNEGIKLSGNTDIGYGAISASMFAYMKIAMQAGQTNDAYFTITYNGGSYQFTLPIGFLSGDSVSLIARPLGEVRDDAAYTVSRLNTGYPVPFFEQPLSSDICPLWDDSMIADCNRIPDPQPVP